MSFAFRKLSKLFTNYNQNQKAGSGAGEYDHLVNLALLLSLITISYNLIEGTVSVFFGIEDKTLTLLGFGVDSFVEVISGLGIFHMIIRMKKNDSLKSRDSFERTALKVTGTSFYLLTAGLLFGVGSNIVQQARPETTFVGIVIAAISIITMYVLIIAKMRVGTKLKSDAIIADANCTKTCFYLSLILLASSFSYEFFQIGYIDEAGSLGIAYFAFKEGRESFNKSKSESLSCNCEDD